MSTTEDDADVLEAETMDPTEAEESNAEPEANNESDTGDVLDAGTMDPTEAEESNAEPEANSESDILPESSASKEAVATETPVDGSTGETEHAEYKTSRNNNTPVRDGIWSFIGSRYGFAVIVFIIFFSVGAAMLGTYSEAREYQLDAENTWTKSTCTVTDQGTIEEIVTEGNKKNRRSTTTRRRSSSDTTIEYKLKIGVTVDGYSTEQVWAKKYAVWCTKKIRGSLKVFTTKAEVKKLQKNHELSGTYPCYYKSGEGVAFRVGGNLYKDKVDAGWSLMAFSMAMFAFTTLLKLYLMCSQCCSDGSMCATEENAAEEEDEEQPPVLTDEERKEEVVNDLQSSFPDVEKNFILEAVDKTDFRYPGQARKLVIVKDLQRRFPELAEDVIRKACVDTEYEAVGADENEFNPPPKDGSKAAKLLAASNGVVSVGTEPAALGDVELAEP